MPGSKGYDFMPDESYALISDVASRSRRVRDQAEPVVQNRSPRRSLSWGPVFVDPVQVAGGTSPTSGFVTVAVPRTVSRRARGLLAEFAYVMTGPSSGDVLANVFVRASQTDPSYEIARGRATGGGNADVSQAMFPFDRNSFTFQLSVEPPGFDLGWSLRIIGWF